MDFPDFALLTKSETPRKVHVTYTHASIGKKPLRETMTNFASEVLLQAPDMTTINAEHDFTGTGDNLRLPTTEVLLYAAVDDLSNSKKLRYWEVLNAVLLPSLLTKSVLTRFKYQEPGFYARLFDEREKWLFEVPPGHTKKYEIIKTVPGATKLYVFQEINGDWVFCSLTYEFFFVGNKISAGYFKDTITP